MGSTRGRVSLTMRRCLTRQLARQRCRRPQWRASLTMRPGWRCWKESGRMRRVQTAMPRIASSTTCHLFSHNRLSVICLREIPMRGVRSGANGSGLAPLYDAMKTREPSRRIRLRRYHESESDLGSSSDSEDGIQKLPIEAFEHIRDAGMTTVRLTRAEYDDVMEKREQEKHQK
ncbi:hypothetical protein J8273_8741 [Carpediemonas membranifera]|uniref:Uncharacterized protein n=1 Tax=Carpediemonas membranifera TaxID=201153 RepID=A0A8J6AX40_9EUKA|nr:hypothetical protein J8273_8741 [Carpediemonas membranifera]|eukprot:KAG9389449.1 hypothetical protein J8273_8741 [Carpediemonas membranifera]